MEKILSIFLDLKFTPNTLGCYGLIDLAVLLFHSFRLWKRRRQKKTINFNLFINYYGD